MEVFGICCNGAWCVLGRFVTLKFLTVLVKSVCDFAGPVLGILTLAMNGSLWRFEIFNLAAVLSGVRISPEGEVNLE